MKIHSTLFQTFPNNSLLSTSTFSCAKSFAGVDVLCIASTKLHANNHDACNHPKALTLTNDNRTNMLYSKAIELHFKSAY